MGVELSVLKTKRRKAREEQNKESKEKERKRGGEREHRNIGMTDTRRPFGL